MGLPTRRNSRLRAELAALAHVGGEALNEWRAQHPDETIRLDRAKLAGVDLRAANLRGTQLTGADLAHADLRGADLTDANLRGASLRHADLREVRGLTPVQLAGCDLTGVQLPASIDPDALTAAAALGESAGYTRHLFMWLAGMCAFCLLTLASMPCCQLLTADGVVKLPVFSASIRTSLFFVAAPVLLIGTFHYLHICLQRLWERLADLPAVFPDGQTLDRKTHGWIILSLALRTPRRAGRRRAMFRTQTALNVVLLYVMVPATVLAIWWRYAFRHDWNRSILHALAVAWTIHLAIGCYAAATGALRGKKRRILLWARHGMAVGALFFLQELMKDSFDGGGMKLFNVHIKGENVSDRPAGWTAARLAVLRTYVRTLASRSNALERKLPDQPPLGVAEYLTQYEQTYAAVRGAPLMGVNLAGARIAQSHLAAADMAGADLSGAEILESDLSRAELGWARLAHATFYSTWAVGASFENANLEHAALNDITALDANFSGAAMAGATANLFADFRRANFAKAKLGGAGLQGARMADANFDGAVLVGAAFDGADLTDASFAGADLRGASFKNAVLKDADFTGAQFGNIPGLVGASPRGVNLSGADLTGCRDLTREQLELAFVDDATKLPEHLVEKPPVPEPPPLAATPSPPITPTEAAPEPEPALAPAEPPHQEVAEQTNPLRRR